MSYAIAIKIDGKRLRMKGKVSDSDFENIMSDMHNIDREFIGLKLTNKVRLLVNKNHIRHFAFHKIDGKILL